MYLEKGKSFMMTERFTNVLEKIANFFNTQKHFSSIKDGLMYTMPFTIIGGIALIIGNPPIPEGTDLSNGIGVFLQAWKELSISWSPFITAMNTLSLGLLSVYVTIAISYLLAKKYDLERFACCAIGLISFLALAAPIANIEKVNYINLSYLDAKGLFTAMIASCGSLEIYRFFISKNIKIRLPESVPEMVSAPFEALIPMIVSVVLFICVSILSLQLGGKAFPAIIMDIMKPFISTSDSLLFVILIGLLVNGFWFLGLHGGSIVGAVMNPFLLINLAANADAIAAGSKAPHILATNYHVLFMNLGGAPAAFPIIIASLICARSAHVRSIAKLGAPASVFGISEPILFGYPIVMNPLLLPGILFIPILNGVITYLLMSMNFIGRICVNVPWTLPGPIGAFIATMDYKAMILWFALFIMDVFLFIPFIKLYDKQMQKQEQQAHEEA